MQNKTCYITLEYQGNQACYNWSCNNTEEDLHLKLAFTNGVEGGFILDRDGATRSGFVSYVASCVECVYDDVFGVTGDDVRSVVLFSCHDFLLHLIDSCIMYCI